MTAAVVQLRAAVERLITDGRREGIEPDGPLGRWLDAQAGALEGLAALLDGQTARLEEIMAGVSSAAEAELEKIRAMSVLADQLAKAGAVAVRRAQAAEIGLICERETVTQKMIDSTLPVVADRLKTLLVIRERAWNRKVAAKRYALAASVALSLFIGGYVLRDFAERTPSQEVDRCFTHPIRAGNRTYCDLDVMLGTGQ